MSDELLRPCKPPEPVCKRCMKPLGLVRRNKIFCSHLCGKLFSKALKRRAARVPEDHQQRRCDVCLQPFTSKRFSQKFCSKPCQWSSLNATRINRSRKGERQNSPPPHVIARLTAGIRSNWTEQQRLQRGKAFDTCEY